MCANLRIDLEILLNSPIYQPVPRASPAHSPCARASYESFPRVLPVTPAVQPAACLPVADQMFSEELNSNYSQELQVLRKD